MRTFSEREQYDPNTVELGPQAAFAVLMCLFAFVALGYFIAGATEATASAQAPDVSHSSSPGEQGIQQEGVTE